MQEMDQRRMTRIIKRDRRATLPRTLADFNAGTSINVNVLTSKRTVIDMGFWSFKNQSCTLVDCTAQRFKPRLSQ
ncbi:hypothetical protein TNCV_3768331 [Trichonephila clavipes]|nr:hypothetical protein TNCV_3768331 [Trichonephila clavipes]